MPKQIDSAQFRYEEVVKNGITYKEFVEIYGNSSADSLDYRIQLWAYKYIENFNYAKIIGLPKVLRRTYHYGITRFRIGSVKTLNEASELFAKAKKNVLRDAFVIVIY